MSARPRYRPPGGIRLGHALLILALGTLVFCARLPSLRREGFERRLSEVRVDVSDLRGAAQRFRARVGRWPDGAPAGVTAAELAFELPRRFDARGDGYAIQWTRWERVVSARSTPTDAGAAPDTPPGRLQATPSRPTLETAWTGAITVVSPDTMLLAALLAEHGRDASFVTDSTWTLLLAGRPVR